jgi:hypothetical protein
MYPPIAMNPAWPRLTCPATPVSRLRPTIVRQNSPVMTTARMSPLGITCGRKNITTASAVQPAASHLRGSFGGE